MSNFVHLHNHSDYSLLESAASINGLIEEARRNGMKHLGLTDLGNMFGALRFEQACHKAGINPVVGSEMYVDPVSRHEKKGKNPKPFHLCLYCRNETGYRNLMKLSSLSYTEGFYESPRIDRELLEKYHEGLMASSACLAGEISRTLLEGHYEEAKKAALWHRDLFGEENYFLELMDHGIPEEKQVRPDIIRLSQETGIPLIATNDIHYLKKEHANAHEILLCIGTGKKKEETEWMKMNDSQYYFKTPEEMASLFSDVPEALTNTVRLAERCDLTIPQPGPVLPDPAIPDGFDSPEDYLRHLVMEGLKKRYESVTEEILARAEYELDIIIRMRFTNYFLLVGDFITWAKNRDIPVGPGRGPAPGSLVAYAMTITDIDPLQYGLLFERFLNPERILMPDIDIDFCYERRGEVIDYVTRKYGQTHVAGICTFGLLKTKAILKEIHERGGIYEELFQAAAVLEGITRHVSTHACGMVIGKTELTDYVPLYQDSKTGTVSSQYTMDIIEPCGLVKMDFLGLKSLTVLSEIERMVRKKNPEFDTETIPEDDEATFELLSRGDTEGVFQLESSGMQDILSRAKPQCLEDLIALNALYRPGPMQFIPQLIENKNNPQNIEYPHPDLEEILKPTYGIIVYQEQIMRILERVGGLSLGKADIIRRLMGKKKEKDLLKWEDEFLEGAERTGYGRKTGKNIFDLLKPFAGYGFNKSHAAAYTLIAYRMAYCRAHCPQAFREVVLTD